MGDAFYQTCRLACKLVRVQCICRAVQGLHHVPASGPALLAVTHISHLEPIIISTELTRRVRWMARVEFYRAAWARFMLHHGGAFPVNRAGWSLPTIRKAVDLLRENHIVGIFPEGGVAQGSLSVLRGGPLKQGVCTTSFAAQIPIIPVVVLGSHKLNRVQPWLPFRRARLWIHFGAPVAPAPRGTARRVARQSQSQRLESAFRATFSEMRQLYDLPESIVP